MPSIDISGWIIPVLVLDSLTVCIAVLVALAIHWITMRALRRFAGRTRRPADDIIVDHARRPLRWIIIALVLAFIRSSLHLDARTSGLWIQAAGLIVPALIGWLAISLIRAGGMVIEARSDISVADNLHARRWRTRSAILTRIAVLMVGFVTICMMLLSIPSVRSVGVTLMASAGLVALAVGAAAQPLLKNLIAGVQLAFTEPIRLDDVVIIDGEWGRIEEIRLTYVIVAIWDERRLVVPVSKFLEESFQNWTRRTSQLLGAIYFYLDPTADVGLIRSRFIEIVTSNPKWDGRAHSLQVTDVKADAMEIRALATAQDSGKSFDLRCDIREAMLAFIRAEMPEALPRGRTEIAGAGWAREPDR